MFDVELRPNSVTQGKRDGLLTGGDRRVDASDRHAERCRANTHLCPNGYGDRLADSYRLH